MQSKAKTVQEYIAQLPADRREAIEAVRAVFKANLDPAIAEGMTYGMIGYFIPHSIYPAGYHCDPKQPLPYAGLAAQKNHFSVYLMTCYPNSGIANWFEEAWAKTGKKLDMGKCCVRFKKLDDLALDVIGEAIRKVSAAAYIKSYEEMLGLLANRQPGKAKAAKSAGAGSAEPRAKTPPKKPAAAKVKSKAVARATKKSAPKPPAKKVAQKAVKKTVKKAVKKAN
jgi:hypothetical protein